MSKYGSRTDDKWAALREAVPSFADHWRAYTAASSYNPLEVGQNIHEFGFHLDEVVASDPEALAPRFVAIEQILPSADEDLRELITINVLEQLAGAAEDAGVDLRRLARLFAGEETRRAWRDALTWTHPECTWDDERGLVPDWPRPVPVG
ncbi:MAG: hypothetical protein JF589_15920, partial [Gemmatimonadetes bacterium]|nr:hypothetical protein [Gemmatimonadota bacterium]